MGEVLVHLIEGLHWSYDADGPTQKPVGAYQTKVDPFPCYHHDLALVEGLAATLRAKAPVPRDVNVNVLTHEDLHRTNGWATHYSDYSKEKEDDGAYGWTGCIVLSGRRTEIHPAITRYVTVHEYGHVVEYALAELRHGKKEMDSNPIRDEYADLRGLRKDVPYGGRTHHLMPCEVMANDFLHVMGVEREYWPHEVGPIFRGREILLPEVRQWWRAALRDLKKASRG